MSIVIELMTLETLEEGVVGLLTSCSWNIAVSRVIQYGFLLLPSTLKESVLL
jgi:hypothetical protein